MECMKHSKDHCTCSYLACDKRGDCCRCVVYHRQRGEIPGCFFSTTGERSYNRSVQNFIRDLKD